MCVDLPGLRTIEEITTKYKPVKDNNGDDDDDDDDDDDERPPRDRPPPPHARRGGFARAPVCITTFCMCQYIH